MLPELGEQRGADDEATRLRGELERLRAERALLSDLLAAPHPAVTQFMLAAARSSARLRRLMSRRAREPVEYLRKVAQLRRLHSRLALLAHSVPLPAVALLYEQTGSALAAAGAGTPGDDLLPALVLIEESALALSMIAERTGLSLTPRRRHRTRSAHARARTAAGGAVEGGSLNAPQPLSRLAQALQQLGERLATEHGKRIELSLVGLEQVPEDLFSSLYDMLAQLLRNAIEHGVETPAQRTAAGKKPCSALLAQFSIRGGQAELVFQDDGQGLQASQILQVGIQRGLIDPGTPLAGDPRQASSLIFFPGVSTAADSNGRGLGMGIVRERVKRMGGRIQVATRRAQFTRIRIRIPLAEAPAQRAGVGRA
jgi:signal transduction histidine kinase